MSRGYLDATVGEIAEQMGIVAQGPGPGFEAALLRITEQVFLMATILAAVPIAVRAAELTVQALTAGTSWLVTKLVSTRVLKFIVEYLAFAALALTAGVVVSELLENAQWISEATVGFCESVAFPAELAALAGAIAYPLGKIVYNRGHDKQTPLKSWFALGLSLVSLLLVMIGQNYQSGTPLAGLDVGSLLTAVAALVFYVVDSAKGIRKAIDVPHALALTFEKLVAFVSPAVMLAKIGVRISGGDYSSA